MVASNQMGSFTAFERPGQNRSRLRILPMCSQVQCLGKWGSLYGNVFAKFVWHPERPSVSDLENPLRRPFDWIDSICISIDHINEKHNFQFASYYSLKMLPGIQVILGPCAHFRLREYNVSSSARTMPNSSYASISYPILIFYIFLLWSSRTATLTRKRLVSVKPDFLLLEVVHAFQGSI